jgi:hypothetical protein
MKRREPVHHAAAGAAGIRKKYSIGRHATFVWQMQVSASIKHQAGVTK